MNNDEVKFILNAYRPNGEDADDPRMREALDRAAKDPELSAWLKENQAFDAAVTDAVTKWPVPAGLKQSILAGQRVSAAPSWWRRRDIAALIASVAVLSMLLVTVFEPAESADAEVFRADMASYLSDSLTGLELYSDNMTKIAHRLSQSEAPHDFMLPPGLHATPSMGCRVLEWNDHAVSLICFKDDAGDAVHLLVIDRDVFPDMPETPQFAQADGWMTAMWARDKNAYLLAGHGAIHQRL